ncbi:hypothetical protein RUND412_011522 [Rhizina undulata]
MPISFRAAYNAHGVDNYYTLVASTYRNPHEPGVRKCLAKVLERIVPETLPSTSTFTILDLAAGSGEATLAALTWFTRHRGSLLPQLQFHACDPYTHELYTTRTGLPCAAHSFRDIEMEGIEEGQSYNVIVSSFALHLCPVSELFGLLYTLSTAGKWLIVLAPHKKPEVKTEMGWERVGEEFVLERTRARTYRSLNFGVGGNEKRNKEEEGGSEESKSVGTEESNGKKEMEES